MKENDDRLRGLLRQWTEIETPPDFEVRVWRQIRAERVAPAPTWRLVEWWRDLGWQSAVAVAGAVLVAGLIGAETGRRTGARPSPLTVMFLTGDTLAGSYVRTLESAR